MGEGKMSERERAGAGFTLVEILVAMGIVMLLAALMLGGLTAAARKAKTTRARSDVAQIVAAWKAYYSDYKHFPDVGGPTITEMGEEALEILRGEADNDSNPRRTEYMDFHLNTDEFLDPWKNRYRVVLDSAPYDGRVDIPGHGSGLKFSAVSWSTGPDGESGTADDVCSWKDR
jgi:type II secretory pathway pseudopilin PulG